jgi:hypothetical protein
MLKRIGSFELTFEAIPFMSDTAEEIPLGLPLDSETRVEDLLGDPIAVVSEAVVTSLKAGRLHLHWKILERQRSLLQRVLIDRN